MIIRKSLVKILINCWGGADVLGPTISDRAVGMGVEGSGVVEGIGV